MGMSAVAVFVEYGRGDDDEDDGMDEDDQSPLPVPQIAAPAAARARGRFLGRSASVLASSRDRFDSVPVPANSPHGGPQRSIEGWIILVSGVKEDAEENDIYDAFCDFGHVKDLHFNLERRTGYGKGYALVEYGSFGEAQTAIRAMDGKQLLTKTIHVDWAFNRGPIQKVTSTRLRGELNPLQEASGGKKISVNDLVIKAAALALRKVPQCNSSWMNDFIRQYNNVDINVAVQTEHGLFVPVVRDADKGLGTIGEEVKQLAQRARDNSLKPRDYEGGTFTVSNLGGPFGIKQFCAIINPPQSAILAIGSAKGSVCIRRQNGGKSETFAASGLDYTDIPNAQIRKVTANPLLASKQTIPHYYLTVHTRVDNLIKLRGELNPLQEASGLHWEATKGNPKGSKKSLPRQSLRPRGRSMSLAPDIIKKIGREVASSSLKDLVVMKLACKAWGSSLEASVPLLVLSCPTSQRIFFLKIKSNEAGFPIIEETDCLFPPPPGSFLCWGAANGAMALYNSELNKTFLHCQACGYEDVLTEVPANHCPKGVFFREENIKMVIMQLEENITMQMLYLEQFVDDESDESDGEQGAANKEEQPVDDEQLENDIELTWAPYPGAEDLEGFQSVSFAPGMTFIAITRYSVVVIDEISRQVGQNMIQLQVDPTDGEFVLWPFNGCHVFTIEQIAHVCFLLRSSSGESVKAKVYQLQSNGNQSYDFIPVTNLGGNSVYLGGNQVIVLPSADNRSNTIYIEDNDGLQRGFQIFAINLETQVVTTMPFPQDIVGSLTDLTAAVWVSPPCWHCQDTSKSRNSGRAFGGDD